MIANTNLARRDIPLMLMFGTAATLGFGIWFASPILIGQLEPWDSAFYLYAATLCGWFLGLLAPRRLVSIYFGAWLGQIAAGLFLPGLVRNWTVVGVFATSMSSLLFFAGAMLGAILRHIIVRLIRRFSFFL